MAWIVVLGFVLLPSNPRVVADPSAPADLLAVVAEILSQQAVRVVAPGAQHAETMARLFRESGATARLTTDVHLAALAIELGARLAANDVDFAGFPGLRAVDPLA